MAKKLIERDNEGRHFFWCPGCDEHHGVMVKPPSGWEFNGDFERPTLSPSVKVTGVEPYTEAELDRVVAGESITKPDRVCHFFVRDGRIEYCGDSTHGLAGQTVEMTAIEDV